MALPIMAANGGMQTAFARFLDSRRYARMTDMESLDFTQPEPAPKRDGAAPAVTYDASAAQAFFGAWGVAQSVPAGAIVFREREQRGLFSGDDRMYLLLEGSIALTLEGKSIDTVNAGEIFGEMMTLTNARRSATASAKSDCRMIALDGGQFKKAIQGNPDFVLMLMSVMVNRFRLTLARLTIKNAIPQAPQREERRVFDDATLKKIAGLLDHPAPLRYGATQTILGAGDPGVFMYFPLRGRVTILSQDRTLQHVGVGSVFGEMALIDSAARSARAVAETQCELMAVNRAQFLQLVRSSPDIGLSLLRLVAQRLQTMTAPSSR